MLSSPDTVELCDDLETNKNVEVLVDKIVKDLDEAVDHDQNVSFEERDELVNLKTTMPNEEPASDESLEKYRSYASVEK